MQQLRGSYPYRLLNKKLFITLPGGVYSSANRISKQNALNVILRMVFHMFAINITSAQCFFPWR
jgi:hypothetical protein